MHFHPIDPRSERRVSPVTITFALIVVGFVLVLTRLDGMQYVGAILILAGLALPITLPKSRSRQAATLGADGTGVRDLDESSASRRTRIASLLGNDDSLLSDLLRRQAEHRGEHGRSDTWDVGEDADGEWINSESGNEPSRRSTTYRGS